MNKNELIDAMSRTSGLTKVACEKALKATVDTISETLKSNESVHLSGFGTFSVLTRKPTTTHNPRTGKIMNVASSNTAKFKPGKPLKDALN
ncbi:MAG: HU family DNA-binding protein [Alphaproteobacteria bacterium]|nr:HU family DNA-binding protein [Alphaproteobacteria bacterium]